MKHSQEGPTALVIEPLQDVRDTAVSHLRDIGYEVVEAIDGAEGLQRLKKARYSIVFCDFIMPDMDGMQCIRTFREWERGNRHGRQVVCCVAAHSECEHVMTHTGPRITNGQDEAMKEKLGTTFMCLSTVWHDHPIMDADVCATINLRYASILLGKKEVRRSWLRTVLGCISG